MFNKVLIAEDLDSISTGIGRALKELQLNNFHHVNYCDDAHLKIQRALLDQEPYDLLITDLSFVDDTRTCKSRLSSGEELIAAVKKVQPDIKIIAFSTEVRPYRIKSLFSNLGISGFVSKGRNSIPELKTAVGAVGESDTPYLSPALAQLLQSQPINEADPLDIEILKLLSMGFTVEQIAGSFKARAIAPSSTSSIEKRINKLKVQLRALNSVHLVSLAKDLGMI